MAQPCCTGWKPRRNSHLITRIGRAAASSLRVFLQATRRILVGNEEERIRGHSKPVAEHSDHEVEKWPRIAAGEQDGKPGDDHADDSRDDQQSENDVVRNRKKPLD